MSTNAKDIYPALTQIATDNNKEHEEIPEAGQEEEEENVKQEETQFSHKEAAKLSQRSCKTITVVR